MSNLGLHTIYRLLNGHAEVRCERAFLPDADELDAYRERGTPLMTVETQRPVADADVLAFSASFENDYPNVLTMLGLANLPLRANQRDATLPLVVMGGATVSINPEPLAPFLDVCCVGEGEELVDEIVAAILSHGGVPAARSAGEGARRALLEHFAAQPGFYVPSMYEAAYESSSAEEYPRFASLTPRDGAPAIVSKVRASFGGPETVAASSVLTPETEFGDRTMIEVARGCAKGCRYCWVGYNVLPFRVHAVDDVVAMAERWGATNRRVGLVATALLDHPDIEAIAAELRRRDFAVFSPSLIISTLREPLLRAVVESGQRSVTIAPETGSDRLREIIMKKVSNEQILEKTRMIFRAGIHSIKNYVIVGLPGETEQDLQDLVDLAGAMRDVMIEEGRERGSIGTITLSVNCLIPKPATPFQWAQQIRPREYRAKVRWLQRRLARVPNVEIDFMSPRSAEIQAVLSRGDRRVADLLERWATGGSWGAAVRDWEASGGSLEHYAYRPIDPAEALPWGHLHTGASSTALHKQWSKATSLAVGGAA